MNQLSTDIRNVGYRHTNAFGGTPMFPTMNDGHNCAGCGAAVRHSETFGTVADHLPDCESA